jgi:hypothetical protein
MPSDWTPVSAESRPEAAPAAPAAPTAPVIEEPAVEGVPVHAVEGALAPSGPGRCWATAAYMPSWIKRGTTTTPLVTTGSQFDDHPGALGQPNTVNLFGTNLDFGEADGVRAEIGFYVDDERHLSLELAGELVIPVHVDFAAHSDSTGNPIITRPVFNVVLNREAAFIDALPGVAVGSVAINAWSELYGGELNARYHWCLGDKLKLEGLGGFRCLRLQESLTIQDAVQPLSNNNFQFQGAFVNPPSTLGDLDHFRTTNTYYGLQLGGAARWEQDLFAVDAFAKLGLGFNDESLEIDGQTTLFTPQMIRVAQGGILALPSNIGQHNRTVFAFVPELGLNAEVHVTPNLQLLVGYSFLYWNEVLRPGAQIDRFVNSAQVPTDNTFGTPGGPPRPQVNLANETFWVHSLTFGAKICF